MTRRVSMTCPDIGYSLPRKKFDSGKIRVLILNVYAACPEPDTSPYFRFSQEYGFVSTNIGTMTQLISHSEIALFWVDEDPASCKRWISRKRSNQPVGNRPRIHRNPRQFTWCSFSWFTVTNPKVIVFATHSVTYIFGTTSWFLTEWSSPFGYTQYTWNLT